MGAGGGIGTGTGSSVPTDDDGDEGGRTAGLGDDVFLGVVVVDSITGFNDTFGVCVISSVVFVFVFVTTVRSVGVMDVPVPSPGGNILLFTDNGIFVLVSESGGGGGGRGTGVPSEETVATTSGLTEVAILVDVLKGIEVDLDEMVPAAGAGVACLRTLVQARP